MKTTKISIFVLVAVFTLSCIGDRSPEEMETAISKSIVFQRINKFCTEMSKPNDFRFASKKFSGNSDVAALAFDYYSEQSPSEIEKFYLEWATENHWIVASPNKYTQKNQTVVIEVGQFRPTNVTISCKENL